jgi:hypothetical protein
LTSVSDLGYIIKFFGISAFVSPWLPWLYNKEEYPLTSLASTGCEREFAVSIYEKLYIERREQYGREKIED